MRKTRRSREKIKAKKAVTVPKVEVKRELTVSAIEEGTVIDHIPTDAVFKVVDILNLDHYANMVSIATNLQSKSIGRKGIIKVGGKSLTQDEVNKIAIVAPDATVNMIKNFEVREKIKVKAPEILDNVIKCSNPVCITNNEQVKTRFYMVKKDPLRLKCHYCERSMGKEDLEIL
jgi:aspartate carbamoyltransferase regulatory subunit